MLIRGAVQLVRNFRIVIFEWNLPFLLAQKTPEMVLACGIISFHFISSNIKYCSFIIEKRTLFSSFFLNDFLCFADKKKTWWEVTPRNTPSARKVQSFKVLVGARTWSKLKILKMHTGFRVSLELSMGRKIT